MASIKETLELIEGLKAVKKIVEEELGDGFQWQEDISDIITKSQQSEAVKAAIDGISEVYPELKDLDLSEKFSLAFALLKAVL
jgi:hypothetical protein